MGLDEWRGRSLLDPAATVVRSHPERWTGFQERYFAELDQKQDAVRDLVKRGRQGRITLVYGARDPDHNQAVALGAYLRARGSGRQPRVRS